MGLSTAERNRRKRERKKQEKEERRKQEQAEKEAAAAAASDQAGPSSSNNLDVEIDYVAESIVIPSSIMKPSASSSSSSQEGGTTGTKSNLPDGLPPGMSDGASAPPAPEGEDMGAILRRFQQRAAVSATVSDDDDDNNDKDQQLKDSTREDGDYDNDDYDDDDEDDERERISKRKLREIARPSIAELKRRVKRPDLVEAHDITAADPDLLIEIKGIPGTVPVPRHWGRKRKYLQGKRGFEKPPFRLPDFIIKTGITEIRDTVAEAEGKQSVKQKNRSRVNPKMGAMDVDYKTLYEAFFKYQTKPVGLTKFGDLYYEGKELETSTDRKPGGPLSKQLREALGMLSDTAPPPWLINMQRYGPPPSYPNLAIPGLNAPLPNDRCQYGYHTGGWGKPPMDSYGRPLYGGNPFDPPGSGTQKEDSSAAIVTSDGKTISKLDWGMPAGHFVGLDDESQEESSSEEEEEESSDEEMEQSDEEEDVSGGLESVLPPPTVPTATAPGDLRKAAGDETPMSHQRPKQLYQVLEQTQVASGDQQQQQKVFQSNVQYVVPGTSAAGAAVQDGVESVLSKAVAPNETAKRKKKSDDDDNEELDKNFKF